MNDSLLNFIQEQFSVLGPIAIKKMFGGAGIYFNGVMFGLVANDIVYLKVSDENRSDYENAGMGPFVYQGKNKPITMSYYQLPEDVLEDPDTLKAWAQKAVQVAQDSRSHQRRRSK